MIRYTCSRTYQCLSKVMKAAFSTRNVGDIDFTEYDSITKVTLNKPKALNSLNLTMIRALKS